MKEKFCMRCGTPLNGAARCPECGYESTQVPDVADVQVQETASAAKEAPQPAVAPVPPAGSVPPVGNVPPMAPNQGGAAYGAPGQQPRPAAAPVPPTGSVPPVGNVPPMAQNQGGAAYGAPGQQPRPAAAPVPPAGSVPPVGNVPPMGPQTAQGGRSPYGMPPYAAPAYGMPGAYAPPRVPYEVPPEPLTMGRTIGTLLIGALPLIGWIVLLIWAFESGAEPNRRTLARSYLVVKAIGWAIVIVFYVLLFAFSFSLMGAMY